MAIDVIEEEEEIQFDGPWSPVVKRLVYTYDDVEGRDFELRGVESVELDELQIETLEEEGDTETIKTAREEAKRARNAVERLAGLKARSAESLDKSVVRAIRDMLPGVEIIS